MKRAVFTMLEMVVAVAILALIAGFSAMTLALLQQQNNRIAAVKSLLDRNLAVDAVCENAVRNAVGFTWVFEGSTDSKLVFRGKNESVYFTYLHRNNGESAPGMIRFIRLFLSDGCLKAAYRNSPVDPDRVETDRDFMQEEVLCRSVKALDFDYAERDPSSEKITWKNDWPSSAAEIPIAWQMRLTFEDGSQEVWLRRTAGNSFYTAYDVRSDENTEMLPSALTQAPSAGNSASQRQNSQNRRPSGNRRPGGRPGFGPPPPGFGPPPGQSSNRRPQIQFSGVRQTLVREDGRTINVPIEIAEFILSHSDKWQIAPSAEPAGESAAGESGESGNSHSPANGVDSALLDEWLYEQTLDYVYGTEESE